MIKSCDWSGAVAPAYLLPGPMKSFPTSPSIEDSELVLEEVLRHTPVGVVLSDLHGTIIDVNDAMCAMIGYDRAELVGRRQLAEVRRSHFQVSSDHKRATHGH